MWIVSLERMIWRKHIMYIYIYIKHECQIILYAKISEMVNFFYIKSVNKKITIKIDKENRNKNISL